MSPRRCEPGTADTLSSSRMYALGTTFGGAAPSLTPDKGVRAAVAEMNTARAAAKKGVGDLIGGGERDDALLSTED